MGRNKIKLRPVLTDYPAIKVLNQKINRIEVYRTQNNRLFFWRPKYTQHILALTDNAVYEIFPPEHKPHAPLFGEQPQPPTTKEIIKDD